jgi:serine O-acetyltransferase
MKCSFIKRRIFLEKNDFVQCLSGGKDLGTKAYKGQNFCAECVMKLEFKIQEINNDQADTNLQKILDFFISDVSCVFHKDPAAHTLIEVLTSYPGIKAVLLYRISHFFHKLGMPFIPRYISDIARELTAIEIHPGAEIGNEFFIDHGAGVVIGETAIVGNNVTMYAGVVLGGTSLEQVKRHPTIGDNVVIGTGAKVLGPITVGDNVRIGANSVVINDVPADSVVVGVPGRIVSREGEKIKRIDLRHGDLPDPLAITISKLEERIREMESKLNINPSKDKDYIDIFYGEYGGGI